MPVHNADIAAVFEEIAELLEIQAANPFRIRAYRNAAMSVGEFGRDLGAIVRNGGTLPKMPGIGEDLSNKIHEIIRTGHCTLLDRLHKQLPAGVTALLKIPGLGPKRVRALYDELHIRDLATLATAAEEHRIQKLSGFGEKTEQRILLALRAHTDEVQRFNRSLAAQYAEPLAAALRRAQGVATVDIAGSYRRCKETVGDIDILITATASEAVMQSFTAYDDVQQVVSQGNTRSTVILRSGLQVDLRVVKPQSHGAALTYFTGSRSHSIALRKRAQRKGLKLNEYGIFRDGKRIASKTEASIYAKLGLQWIPPELRENRGEIEWAEHGPLPTLVTRSDLRGDLHSHTKASDGHATLADMARAAKARGLDYLAITEHSQRLTIAHGLNTERLLKHIAAIERLNESLEGITLLTGIEVDILEDGSLDLPVAVLGRLDLVIGSVHSGFGLSRAKQTRRLLKAMDHPHFTVLGHPTTRELGKRPAIQADWLKIIRHARGRGCHLELNSQPKRLDLPDTWCRVAKEEGVLIAINSDAHSAQAFDNLVGGICQARRGWLSAADVLNSRSLRTLRPLLAQTM